MEKTERLKQIESEIKKLAPEAFFGLIENEHLEKPLLIVSSKGTSKRIMLYDETIGLSPVAEIAYSRSGKKRNISVFEVNENFQNKGLGKFLFNLAAIHCDIMGTTGLYGEANPTNNIKGVSNVAGNTFNDEKQAIITVYKRLGCTFEEDNNFTLNWETGNKIKSADERTLNLAYAIAEKDGFVKENPNQPQN